MTRHNLPSKPYDEIKSEFIKERISERQFELDSHRKYIKELIFLERVILDEIELGYPSGMKYNSIKKKHKEEYMKILEELDPEKYQERKKKQERQRPSYKRANKKDEELQKAKKKWEKVKA